MFNSDSLSKSDFELKLSPTLTWFPGQWRLKTHHFGVGRHGPAMQVRDSSFQCSALDREPV